MLKKRILASSMASVMALGSVSLVAFADTKDYGEAVTKAELEEYVKSFEDFINDELNDYGTIQADNFRQAVDHAKVVLDDGKAVAKDYNAAYQMVKAVEARLVKKTNDDLKGLIKDNQAIFDTENILNEDFQDEIYKGDKWDDFYDAFKNAEYYVDTDSSRDITDAYLQLEEAAANLQYADYVTKSEFRTALAAYEQLELKMKSTEDWRRGVLTVAPTTGTIDKDKDKNKVMPMVVDKKLEISFEALKDMVYGSSTGDDCLIWVEDSGDYKKTGFLKYMFDEEKTASDYSGNYTWIGNKNLRAADALETITVKEAITAQSDVLTKAKGVVKTSQPAIVAAYKAAVDAVAVFNGWTADNAKGGNKKDCATLWNTTYHNRLVEVYNTDAIAAIYGTDLPTSKDTNENEGISANVTYDPGAHTLTADTALYIVIDSNNKMVGSTFYDDLKAAEEAAAGMTNCSGKQIAKNKDIIKYLPTGEISGASGEYATELEEAYALYAAYLTADAGDEFDASELDSVKDYMDELVSGKTIPSYTGSPAEWSIVWRNLKYSLEDFFYEPAKDADVTLKMLEAKIAEAYELCEKTGDSNVFADPYAAVVEKRQEANTFVKLAKAKSDYKDGQKLVVGETEEGDPIEKTVKDVYNALKGKVSALNKWYNDFKYSYDDIRVTISDVAGDIDKGVVAGDAIKKALEECAFRLSVVVPTELTEGGDEEENVVFDDELVFQVTNRLKVAWTIDGKVEASASEKALFKAYDALIKAYAEAKAGDAKDGYDVDGSGIVDIDDVQVLFDTFVMKGVYDAKYDFNGDKLLDIDDVQIFFEKYVMA